MVQNKPINVLPRIYLPYVGGLHNTGIYHVYPMYIPCIFQSGSNMAMKYQEYSLYILDGIYFCIFPRYTVYIHCIYWVYTLYILSIYTGYIHIVHNGIYQDYTKYIPCTSNQKAWRRWTSSSLDLRSGTVSVDLDLCCHWVTFNVTINLHHDDWLMSDGSLVQDHRHSNLRNQDMK